MSAPRPNSPSPTETDSVFEAPRLAGGRIPTIDDMVVITDPQGAVIWVNQAFVHQTGYALNELLGRKPGDLLQGPQTDVHAVSAMRRAVAEGIRCEPVEIVNYRKDGSAFLVRMEIEPVRGADGRITQFVSVQRDLTAWRRQVQDEEVHSLRLQLVRDSAMVGFWERHLDTGNFRFDEQVGAMWGLDPQGPAVGIESLLSRIPEPDRTLFISATAAARQTREPTVVRFRVQQPSGELRSLQSIWRVSEDGRGGLVAAGMTIDITESNGSRDQRARLAHQLELGVALTGMAIWVSDLSTGRVTLNPQAFELFELDPGMTVTRDVMSALLHPQDSQAIHRLRDEALRTQQAVGASMRVVTRSGRIKHVLVRAAPYSETPGGPLRMVGAAVDISEQMDRAQALDDLARRLQLMVDVAELGSWEFNSATRLLTMDARDLAIHGLPADRGPLRLRQWLAMVHAQDRAAQRALFTVEAAIGDFQQIRATQYRIVLPDGQVRHIRVSYRLVADEHGQVTGAFGTDLDVTEENLAREMLQMQDQLRLANQSKSEFISRLSHELRTPLNAILGFSQLLEMGGAALGPRELRYVGQIGRAGQHMLRLVNEVVQMAQLEAGALPVNMAPVAVAEVLRASRDMLQPLADQHEVDVQLSLPDEPVALVLADAQRLQQVVLNLLSNGIKYNRPGGWVRLRLVPLPATAGQCPSVSLEVQDNGLGMHERQLAELFVPYARLGQEQSSIEGLGLTKAMVERMDGRIEVTSQVGAGSLFRVILRCALDGTVADQSPAADARGADVAPPAGLGQAGSAPLD